MSSFGGGRRSGHSRRGVGGAMRLVAATITALCMAAVATLVGLGPSGIGVAAAAAPLDCSTATVYSIGAGAGGANPQGLYSLATSGLGATSVPATLVATDTGAVNGAINGLGITANGTAAYWVNRGNGRIYEYLASTGVVSNVGASGVPAASLGSVVAGAVNPANGIFYDAYASSTGTMVLFAFNTATNASIGQLATASAPSFSNGDIAFDGGGNLYWVGSSGTTAVLGVIPGPIPTTAGNAPLTGKQITTYPNPNSVQFDGIAFDSAGNLYLQELVGGTTSPRAGQPAHGRSHRRPDHGQPGDRGHRPGHLRDGSVAEPEEERGRPNPGTDEFHLAVSPAPGSRARPPGRPPRPQGRPTGFRPSRPARCPWSPGTCTRLPRPPAGQQTSARTRPRIHA